MILHLHAAATLYLVGLIWFVQLVHYPLMNKVGQSGYAEYQRLHEKRTTWAVAPAMFIELGTAAWLVIATPDHVMPWLTWLGWAMVVMLWLSTALLQVPCHKKMGEGFDQASHKRLVETNWLRTILWSARGAIALVMLSQA